MEVREMFCWWLVFSLPVKRSTWKHRSRVYKAWGKRVFSDLGVLNWVSFTSELEKKTGWDGKGINKSRLYKTERLK